MAKVADSHNLKTILVSRAIHIFHVFKGEGEEKYIRMMNHATYSCALLSAVCVQ